MKKEKNTTITIRESTWNKLNQMKRLGESMDDLLKRLYLHQVKEEIYGKN